ncbi:NUDIX hydrolase [Streptomyces sp. NK08204]|uniref:NUDIX hydrolase n=1 Tax=Streptomyces sp. NK08204 TaxID=2873260 RepID=UPI001CEC5CBA|nr:NUDIX domain-containing protein [Streptomyces sp. NK08204]
MTLGQAVAGTVQAVVVYDGRLLLVARHDRWGLPSGTPEPAESAQAAAGRIVYELTGYLVDGSQTLQAPESGRTDAVSAVVCHLLSEAPSEGGSLAPEQLRWAPFAETAGADLPDSVRDYLQGHTPA